jgi:CcmD family protein
VVDPTAIPELGIAGGKAADTTQRKVGTPEDRSTEFVAVEGGNDTTSSEALLVSAYLVMWALLLGFVWLTWRRQQKMEARVMDLERTMGGTRGAHASLEP